MASPGSPILDTADISRLYPLTAAAFAQMENGAQALRAVQALEHRWKEIASGRVPGGVLGRSRSPLPRFAPEREFDVIIAGGGLGLVMGLALARFGWRVLVFDRDAVGAAHREWNISRQELAVLVEDGLFTWAELETCIATNYRSGLISFCADGTGLPQCDLKLEGVLDMALDAQMLLNLARRRYLEAGGTILEGRRFKRAILSTEGPVRSVIEMTDTDGKSEHYGARLLIDMMGSISPIAMTLNRGKPFDGVCPTAGTVVRGLAQPAEVGDILVTVAGTQQGRQLIWEGFPGRHEETTVYLFYYDLSGPEYAVGQSLLDLFETYFARLHEYRPAGEAFAHLRPVYGYIPSRHGRRGETARRGLLCLGDAAAGQSPLTFCGFGSFVRHLVPTSRRIDAAMRADKLERRDLEGVGPHQANLKPTWAFSRLMQPWPGSGPNGVNRLLNAFTAALAKVGTPTTRRFLQDRHSFADYIRILLTTARYHPEVFAITLRALGPRGMARWVRDIASFGLSSLREVLPGAPRGHPNRSKRSTKSVFADWV